MKNTGIYIFIALLFLAFCGLFVMVGYTTITGATVIERTIFFIASSLLMGLFGVIATVYIMR